MKDADTELRHRLGDDPATWKPSMRMIGAGRARHTLTLTP